MQCLYAGKPPRVKGLDLEVSMKIHFFPNKLSFLAQ